MRSFKILALFISVLWLAGCSSHNNISNLLGPSGEQTGSVLCKVSTANVVTGVIKTADLQVAGNGMVTITKRMSVNPSAIEGQITGIPVGHSRTFKVMIYDSLGEQQYTGQATADVVGGDTVAVPMVLTRVTGAATINGVIQDVAPGYRYYKFVVSAMNLGGSSCGILTETSFLNDSVPVVGGYTVLSSSTVAAGSIESLFDGDLTVGASTGLYMKFTTVPWQWVVDMGATYKFTALHIASWETFYYHEPSQVTVYGSSDATNWNQIGGQTFTTVYQDTLVPLSY